MAIGQNAVGASFDETLTLGTAVNVHPEFELGTVMWDAGKAYIYVQASGAITGDGYVCSIEPDFQAAMVDTDTAATVAEGLLVGVAETDFADDDYGWLQIFGPCGIRTEQDAAAHGKLAPTADAGQVDDAGATGTAYIDGMIVNTATGGADAVNTTGFINFPKIALVGTYA